MTRQQKTPRQRAEEALAVEQRKVTRLANKVRALNKELGALEAELDATQARRDFLANHPDLQHTTNTTQEKTA